MMELYPYQAEIVESVVSEPTKATLIAADMGAGKTLIAVECIRRFPLVNKTVLVVCPLATRVSWERTFKGQGLTVPVERIDSTKRGKETLESLKKGVPGVYLIGREYFRRHDWSKFKKVGALIVDEVHIFSNRKTVGIKALRSLKPEWKIAMSGTPWANKFENAWTIAHWLWGSPTVPSRFWGDDSKPGFVTLYANTETQFLGGRKIIKVTSERVPGKFVSDLPNYHRPPVPPHPINRDVLFVELNSAQRKMYDTFEQKSYVWLGDKALVEDVPIVERIRLREMTLGTVDLDEEGNVIFTDDMKSAKVDALKDFLSDRPDEPVLILTHSKKFARIVANRIQGSRLWTGDTSQDERETLIEEFGTTYKYLVATAAALAEGVDGLQHNCETMVWLSRTENNMLNQQVERRIARQTHGGVRKPVLCVDILAVDTYDESINNSLYFTERMNQLSLNGKKNV